MIKPITELAGQLQYLVLRGAILSIRALPYRLTLAMGRGFGLLAWACLPLQRKISTTQIHHTLGAADARTIARRAFMHQGELLVDTIKFAYMDKLKIEEKFVVQGREHIEAALASPRGVMGFTGHLNWEMFAHMPHLLGFHYSVMGDVMKNPRMQSIIEELREHSGGFTLLPPKGGMVNTLTEELRQGRTIGMVIDQRGKRSNKLFCDILGLPAPTSPAPALIGLRGDALLLPITTFKEGDTYTIRFEEPIDVRDFGDDFKEVEGLQDAWRSTAVRELNERMHALVSRAAGDWPEQYFWVHSRWLRRSDMKRLLKDGGDFKDVVCRQAAEYCPDITGTPDQQGVR